MAVMGVRQAAPSPPSLPESRRGGTATPRCCPDLGYRLSDHSVGLTGHQRHTTGYHEHLVRPLAPPPF